MDKFPRESHKEDRQAKKSERIGERAERLLYKAEDIQNRAVEALPVKERNVLQRIGSFMWKDERLQKIVQEERIRYSENLAFLGTINPQDPLHTQVDSDVKRLKQEIDQTSRVREDTFRELMEDSMPPSDLEKCIQLSKDIVARQNAENPGTYHGEFDMQWSGRTSDKLGWVDNLTLEMDTAFTIEIGLRPMRDGHDSEAWYKIR